VQLTLINFISQEESIKLLPSRRQLIH